MKTGVTIALALILAAVGSVLFLVGVGFGIQHGEMKVDTNNSRQLAERVNRAGDLSMGLFFAAELGATVLILNSGLRVMPGVHRNIKGICVLIAAGLCSYLGALLVLTLGVAPDPVISLQHTLSDWMLRIAR